MPSTIRKHMRFWTLLILSTSSLLPIASSFADTSSFFFANSNNNNSNNNNNKPIIVICPGFGNAVVDYVTPLGASPDQGFKGILERRGFTVRIVPVERRTDWIRVALGLFDPAFWKSDQRASGIAYGWYLQRTIQTIASAANENNNDKQNNNNNNNKVLVVGHSAGGWLARAALGEMDPSALRNHVCGLVTLGAPHFPPPDGIDCATRGALKNTNLDYPGAFFAKGNHDGDGGLVYITVVGNAVQGGAGPPVGTTPQQLTTSTAKVDAVYAQRGEGSAQNVARVNYQALVGEFEGVSGDGVIPISIAHLEGAKQITLDGVLHSINEAGTTLPTERWYGSEKIVDLWLSEAMEAIQAMK